MAKQSKSPKGKKCFVKEDDGIFIVYDEFFNAIESRSEALVIAMRTLGEIHNTLEQEAQIDGPLFIENMKVTTGLQRCLDELERRWPFLITELHATPRRINGQIISTC
jgi:hypothetical protein